MFCAVIVATILQSAPDWARPRVFKRNIYLLFHYVPYNVSLRSLEITWSVSSTPSRARLIPFHSTCLRPHYTLDIYSALMAIAQSCCVPCCVFCVFQGASLITFHTLMFGAVALQLHLFIPSKLWWPRGRPLQYACLALGHVYCDVFKEMPVISFFNAEYSSLIFNMATELFSRSILVFYIINNYSSASLSKVLHAILYVRKRHFSILKKWVTQ